MPMMGQPPPPPPPGAPTFAPASTPPKKGRRRKGLIILGLVIFVVGLLGGGAVVAKSVMNYEEAVKSMARAPVGCTTTLVFDKPATFTVYIETKGKLGDLGGDCESNGGSYEHKGDKLPKVSLTLEGPDGQAVDLQRGATATYDINGYKGTAIRTVKITEAGTYHLNVESDESDFAISIGKDPEKDSELLIAIGGGIALGGIVLGLLLFLLGLRRRRPEPELADIRNPAAPMPVWPPATYGGVPPTAPPLPPMHPGFREESPPPPPPPTVPGQPPIRLPDQPSGGWFAPPTFAPPTVEPPTVEPPTVEPPTVEPPTAVSPPTVEGPSWTLPEDRRLPDEDDDDERSPD
jgi:hypothetical protein